MIADQHIVEKVKVDVDVDSLELAEKIKLEINDFIQNEVLSIVENYFLELDLPESFNDKVIQLEKVDLSIDTASWNPQSVRMKQEIRDEVSRQMNPIIQELKDQTIRDKDALPKGFSDIKEPNANVYSKQERVLKSAFYFLDHGTLPWWVQSVEESRELFTEESLISALNEHTVLAKREFQKRRNNSRFVERLVQQFSLSIVSEFIQIELSHNRAKREKITSELVEEFKNLPNPISSKLLHLLVEFSEPSVIGNLSNRGVAIKLYEHIRETFHTAEKSEKRYESALKTTNTILRLLSTIGDVTGNLNKAKLEFKASLDSQLPHEAITTLKETNTYRNVFDDQLDSSNDSLENLEISSEKKQFLSPNVRDRKSQDAAESRGKKGELKETEIEKLRDVLSENEAIRTKGVSEETVDQAPKNVPADIETAIQKEKENRQSSSDDMLEDTAYDGKEVQETSNSDKLSEVLKKRAEVESHDKKMEDKMPSHMFVENAGLVLLNPFLPSLFKHLELVDDDGKLTDPALAACLLHYAATGREGDYEFEMTFEKYLCGIPPSFSLNRDIVLSESQKSEVGKVLNSVMEHWTALKSKSTELLQNEFLSRSGKLIVEKSNHRLVIEKKTFDLLLDKLPWSYSLIKFSWKKELLFVEW